MKSAPPDWSEPIVEKPIRSKADGGRRLLIAVVVACLIALPAIGVWAALPAGSTSGLLHALIWIVLLTAITAGAFTTIRVARRPRRAAVVVEPGEDPPIVAKSQVLLGTPQSLEYYPSTGRIVCRGCRRTRGFTRLVDPVWECSVDEIIAARIARTRGGPYLILHTATSKITLFFQSGGKELLEALRCGIPMIGGPETDEPVMVLILNLWPYFGLFAMLMLSPLQMSDFRFYTGVVGAMILGAVVPYLIVWGAQRWFGIRLAVVLTGVTIGAAAGIGLGSVLARAARSEFVVMLLGDRSRAAAWVLGIALGAWIGGAIGGWIQGKREAESALIRARGKMASVPEV